MLKIKLSKIKSLLTTGVISLSLGAPVAMAAVPADQAAKLGQTLTPFGSERATNTEGTIPQWTGGLTKVPEGIAFQGGGQLHPDPFVDEKPLFEITSENMAQYADKLSEGQKALFEKYPQSFKMPVYPSHRTHALPQWVMDNTKSNATTAALADGGNGVENAFGGYPFPIPENGLEVLWNHLLRWQGEGNYSQFQSMTVQPNGKFSLGGGFSHQKYPFYQQEGSVDTFGSDFFLGMYNWMAPHRLKGEVILLNDPLNQAETPRKAWQYIPGQRRVRRAPTIAYDTPNDQFSGQATYDDAWGFFGSPDRYDWKLVGKQEVYIPYNNYQLDQPFKNEEIIHKGHINPAYERYELHRVWVVEANLKPGKRHIYAKRVFFIDEDSWNIALADSYDSRGNLWRTNMIHTKSAYELPGVVQFGHTHMDLIAGSYVLNDMHNETGTFWDYAVIKGDDYFTPSSLRKLSRR